MADINDMISQARVKSDESKIVNKEAKERRKYEALEKEALALPPEPEEPKQTEKEFQALSCKGCINNMMPVCLMDHCIRFVAKAGWCSGHEVKDYYSE